MDSDVNYSTPNFEVPAYMRQSPRSSERVSTKKSQKPTLLVILQTFEASAQKVFAQQRFVRNLESLTLPTELGSLVDNLTVILGDKSKAWAVVLQWMAAHLAAEITLSRQAKRLLRQVLKDVDANVLQELNLTWKAKVFALMVREVPNMGCQLELEGLNIPAFLRQQVD